MIKLYSETSIWMAVGQMVVALIVPWLVSFPLSYFVTVMMIFGTSVAISIIAELAVIAFRHLRKYG